MPELNDWNIAAASNNSAPPDGWPESTMQYSEVNDTAREGMAVLARYFRDINGSLAAGGLVNAYTLTLNATQYVAYFEGMYFVCSIPITNTGAATINVNAIGAASIVDRAGNALIAGTLVANGLYEFRYDGTNFQLMGTADVLSGTSISIRADINTATPPTTEAVSASMAFFDAAGDDQLSRIGFIGSNQLRLRNQMHGAGVAIEGEDAAGTVQTIFSGDPDAESSMYYAGGVRLQAGSNSIGRVRGDTSPGLGLTQITNLRLEQADTEVLAQFGFISSPSVFVRNLNHGGNVVLDGEDTGGVLRNLLIGDPDNNTALYDAGTQRLGTLSSGRVAIYSDGNTDTEARNVQLMHANGTARGRIGYLSSADMRFENQISSGDVNLVATNAGAASRTLLEGDPDSYVRLRDPVGNVVRLSTAASGIVALRSDGNTDTEVRQLQLQHQDGTLRAEIGHTANDVLVMINRIQGGNVLIQSEDAVGSLRTILQANPDATAEIWHPDTNTVNLATAQHDFVGNISGATVRGPDNALHGIGYNYKPRVSISGGNVSLLQDHIGKLFFYNEATARSLILNNNADILEDTHYYLLVGPLGGTLTIDGATGVTLTYWNGTSWTVTAAGGNITAGEGLYDIWKDTDTNFYVFGPNLS